jgi:hypothetical protein
MAKIKILDVYTQPKERGKYGVKTRMYAWPKGESVAQNLIFGRFTRPRDAIRAALPEIGEKLGVRLPKAVWSQTAGCGCGCSPGFVIDARLGYDIFVDYEVVEADELTPEQEAEAVSRYEQISADPTLGPVLLGDRRLQETEAEARAAYGDR